MTELLLPLLEKEVGKLIQAGLYKNDVVFGPDGRDDKIPSEDLINFTNHDYLGLANNSQVLEAMQQAMEYHGFGQTSSRLLSGTRSIHQELEEALSRFLGTAASMVLNSGYLANIGLFQALFDDRDYVFCDEVINPSLAEGVRLSGARTYSYRNNDMEDLEDKLKRSRGARFRAVVTTGVFPFDGAVANLVGMIHLAKKYDAITIVDDSLGIGVLGPEGRGSCEARGVVGQIDVITGSFGKALGGASGGFVAGCVQVIQWLRQKSTPYLFSSAMSPGMVGGVLKALEILETGGAPLDILHQRVTQLRTGLIDLGFSIVAGQHPLTAISIGNVVTMQKLINTVYKYEIYAHGLCYPVVPEREDRVILQVCVRHSKDDIDQVIKAFAQAGKELDLI